MSISHDLQHVIASALDASEDLLVVFDVDAKLPGRLRLADVSDAFLRFIGHGRAWLVGRPFADLTPPDARDELKKIEAAVDGCASVRGELLCTDLDARRLWLGYHLMPAPATEDPRPRYVLIGRDITHRRLEADHARMVQKLLARSFMLADAPLAIMTPDGRFLMANLSFEALAGCKPNSLQGRPSFDVLGPDSRLRAKQARDRQMTDGAPYRIEVDLQTEGGQLVPVQLASAIVERSDRQRFLVVTLHPRGAPSQAESPANLPPAKRPDYQTAGRIGFISLDNIREKIGARWEAVANRVMETTEFMIRKRLKPGESVARSDAHGFTICFMDASEEESARRAAEIGRDIRAHLIGRGEDPDLVEMQVMVARVKLQDNDPVEQQLTRHMDNLADDLRRAEQEEPIRPPRLQPLYQAATGAQIGVYARASPRSAGGGAIVFPESSVTQDVHAVRWVAQAHTQNRVLPMVVLDVNFETFVDRQKCELYMEACTGIDASIRPNVTFMLSPLPQGVTLSLLQDIRRRLKPFGRGFGCHLAEFAPPAHDLRVLPMSLVTIDMRPWKRGDTVPADRVRRLVNAVHMHNTKLLAIDTGTIETRLNLHALGVDHVSLASDR